MQEKGKDSRKEGRVGKKKGRILQEKQLATCIPNKS
jgi:hypothetical protein